MHVHVGLTHTQGVGHSPPSCRMATSMKLLCAALVATASASPELTGANFDELVFASGKAAFVKFLAPW